MHRIENAITRPEPPANLTPSPLLEPEIKQERKVEDNFQSSSKRLEEREEKYAQFFSSTVNLIRSLPDKETLTKKHIAALHNERVNFRAEIFAQIPATALNEITQKTSLIYKKYNSQNKGFWSALLRYFGAEPWGSFHALNKALAQAF